MQQLRILQNRFNIENKRMVLSCMWYKPW